MSQPRISSDGLEKLEIGGGQVETSRTGRIRLTIPPSPKSYTNAQLDDYRRLSRRRFRWRSPASIILRARASHPEPVGTLGFGFWNDPFTLSLGQGGAARRFPATPSALWFFYGSPPNDLALDPDQPGHGWKASALVSKSIPSVVLAPMAALGIALAQIPPLRGWVMRTAQRFVAAREHLLEMPLDQWHEYQLSWEADKAIFSIDKKIVLETTVVPTQTLGFVAWIDNQFAVASPEGGFRFGVIPTVESQWLEIEDLVLGH